MKKRKIYIITFAVAVILFLILFHFRYFFIGTSTEKVEAKSNADFGIADIQSSMDRDGDGIDDQRDVLNGARAYTENHPKYKSKYYTTGYPNDGYGVCTDVVAHALLSVAYDLMELVNEDISQYPEDYPIEEPDINIDFRRVKNLNVYGSCCLSENGKSQINYGEKKKGLGSI